MLLALEPGIEVDVEAAYGSLGRPLNCQDRRRLWRKLRQWETSRSRRTATWHFGGKAAKWVGEAVERTEQGDNALMDQNPAGRGKALEERGPITKVAKQDCRAKHCLRLGGESGRATSVANGVVTEGGAERAGHEPALAMAEGILGRVRDAALHEPFSGCAMPCSGSGGEREPAKGVVNGAVAEWEAERAGHGPALAMAEGIPGRLRDATLHEPFGGCTMLARVREERGSQRRGW